MYELPLAIWDAIPRRVSVSETVTPSERETIQLISEQVTTTLPTMKAIEFTTAQCEMSFVAFDADTVKSLPIERLPKELVVHYLIYELLGQSCYKVTIKPKVFESPLEGLRQLQRLVAAWLVDPKLLDDPVHLTLVSESDIAKLNSPIYLNWVTSKYVLNTIINQDEMERLLHRIMLRIRADVHATYGAKRAQGTIDTITKVNRYVVGIYFPTLSVVEQFKDTDVSEPLTDFSHFAVAKRFLAYLANGLDVTEANKHTLMSGIQVGTLDQELMDHHRLLDRMGKHLTESK